MTESSSEKEGAAHTKLWQTSDAIFGIGLVVGFSLEYFVPLSFKSVAPALLLYGIGGIFLLFGIALVLLTRWQLFKAGQSSKPGKPTKRLLTTGVFAYTRNPIYVGVAVAFAGLSISANMPWLLIVLIPILVLVRYVLIGPEERYLEQVFGDEYRRYAASVRRWA